MKLLVVHALVISLRLVQGKIDDASKEVLPGRFHEGIEDVEEKDLGETGATKPWDGEVRDWYLQFHLPR